MSESKVYIGHFYGKGLFHTYDRNIENGLMFFMNKNLGELVKDVVRVANVHHDKVVPIVCTWKTFIIK